MGICFITLFIVLILKTVPIFLDSKKRSNSTARFAIVILALINPETNLEEGILRNCRQELFDVGLF